jgi:hypothetical protein
MAEAAPDCIIDAERVIFETPNPTHGSVAADEAPLLNVLLTNGPAAKLADGSRFLFTRDAFHIRQQRRPCSCSQSNSAQPLWQNQTVS